MSRSGIVISQLTKSYPRAQSFREFLRRPFGAERFEALSGIDLTLPRGGIYALLGPNGAGKTTLMKALAGLILPESGRLSIDGDEWPSEKLRASVGLVINDERSFYWRLSVRENLRFFATLQGFHAQEREDRVSRCLQSVDLQDVETRRFSGLSTGMRQRLAIARGLLHEPTTLLMDEPTRSLDPESSARIHDQVTRLHESEPSRIIIYSTHDLVEAETIASHVIVMRKGRVVAFRELEAQTRSGHVYRMRTEPVIDAAFLRAIDSIEILQAEDQEWTIRFGALETLDAVIDGLRRDGIRIVEITPHRSTVNELYESTRGDE